MNEERLREELIKYKETFGTPISWMAKRFGIARSLLSSFINKCAEINTTTILKIELGYKQLPKEFRKGE